MPAKGTASCAGRNAKNLRLGQLVPQKIPVGDAAAVAVAGHVDGIVHGADVAHHVAERVQALDGLTLGVKALKVDVRAQAAGNGQQGRTDLQRVERPLLHRGQEHGLFVVVGVLARLAHAVVALDRGLEGVRVAADLLGQLVERVGLVRVSSLDVGGDLRLEVLGRQLQVAAVGTERIPEHAAAVGQAVHEVGLPVRVEDGPRLAVRLAVDGQRLALHPGVLAHETLAVVVDEQKRAMEPAERLRVHHRGQRQILQLRAGPHAHLVAVARVHAHRRVLAAGLAVLGADGSVRLHHLGIAADVARAQHDALARVVLHVAVARLADAADDSRALLHQLHGGRIEHEFSSVLHGIVIAQFGAGEPRRGEARLLGNREHVVSRLLGVHVVVAVERAHHRGAAHGLGLRQQPVRRLLGVVEELRDEILVRAAGALGDPVLLGVHLVHLDAQLVHVVRVDGAEAAAAAVPAGRLLDDGHLAALLGRRRGACAAGQARADDEDVGVHRAGDIGDGLRRDLPRVAGLARCGAGRILARCLRAAVRARRRSAAGQTSASGDGGGGAQPEERATGQPALQAFRHEKPLSFDRGAPQPRPQCREGGCRRAAAGGERRRAAGAEPRAASAMARAASMTPSPRAPKRERVAPSQTAAGTHAALRPNEPPCGNPSRRTAFGATGETASHGQRANGERTASFLRHPCCTSKAIQSSNKAAHFRRTAAYGPLWPIPLGFLRACIRPTDLLGSRQSDTGREGGGSSWDGRNAREPGGPRGGNSAREWATPQDKRNAKTARAAPGSPAGGCSAWDFGRHGG